MDYWPTLLKNDYGLPVAVGSQKILSFRVKLE